MFRKMSEVLFSPLSRCSCTMCRLGRPRDVRQVRLGRKRRELHRFSMGMKKAQFVKAKDAVDEHVKETASAGEVKEVKHATLTGYAAIIHAPNAKKVKALIRALKGGLSVIEITSPGWTEVHAALQTKNPELLVSVGDQFLAPVADVKNERWGALTERATNLRKACEAAAGLREQTGKKIKKQPSKLAVVKKPRKEPDDGSGIAKEARGDDNQGTGKSTSKAQKEKAEKAATNESKKSTDKKTKGYVVEQAEAPNDQKKASKNNAKEDDADKHSGSKQKQQVKKTESSRADAKQLQQNEGCEKPEPKKKKAWMP